MSEFSHHQQCPRCAANGRDTRGDNLGVWVDGSAYCFSCGYTERAYEGWKRIKPLMLPKTASVENIVLPPDSSNYLPEIPAKSWYRQYQITDTEANEYNFLWSEYRKMLIMPIYNKEGKLVLWQGRNFKDSHNKYHTEGKTENVDFIVEADVLSDEIVVVEDILSAIKVGRVLCSLPLFGSYLSEDRAARLSQKFTKLTIWLDFDKTDLAMKYRSKFMPLFKDVSVIARIKDPKCYTTGEIRKTLMV